MNGLSLSVSLLAALSSTSKLLAEVAPDLSGVTGYGALGVMAWVIVALLRMRRDDRAEFNKQYDDLRGQNKELMGQLINKCPSCDLAKAANKSLIEDDEK